MNRFSKFVLSVIFLAAVFGAIVWGTRKPPQPQDGPVASWMEVASSRFRVRYKTPTHWTRPDPAEADSYKGWNGFVEVSGIGGPEITIEDALRLEVEARVNPYGSNADVKSLTVDGQPALLVLPSEDQAAADGRSVLIVNYPLSVEFRAESYQHLILWADRAHIQDIASTLTFVQGRETVQGTLAGHVSIESSLKDVFKNRKILVSSKDGQTLIKTVDIDDKGDFSVELDAGTYVVDINHVGLDRADSLPKTVTIEAGQIHRLNVTIDTGIK